MSHYSNGGVLYVPDSDMFIDLGSIGSLRFCMVPFLTLSVVMQSRNKEGVRKEREITSQQTLKCSSSFF